MPFNASQRSTLRQSMRVMIDEVIENRAGAHLLEVISSLRLRSQDELRTQISEDIIDFVLSQVSISAEVRESWCQIRASINSDAPLTDQLLKDLSSTPNYDPQKIVELKYFEKNLCDKGLSSKALAALMRLREAYLGMTPIDNYSYGRNYTTFAFHIGEVPLNLDKMGSDFTIAELQGDIEEIVTERAEIWDETQKEILQLGQENAILIANLNAQHREHLISLQVAFDVNEKEPPIFNIKVATNGCRRFLYNSENRSFNSLKKELALLRENVALEFEKAKFSSEHFEELASVINSNLEIKNITFNPDALSDKQRKELEEIIINHKKIAGEYIIRIHDISLSQSIETFYGNALTFNYTMLKRFLKQIRTEISVEIEKGFLSDKFFAEIISIIKANPHITSFRFHHECGLNDQEKNRLKKIAKNNQVKLMKAANLSRSYKWRYTLTGALVGVSLPLAFGLSYFAYFVIVPLLCFIASKMGQNSFIYLKQASENYPDKKAFNNLNKNAQNAFCSGLKAEPWKGYLASYLNLKTYTNRDVFSSGMYYAMTDKEKWQKRVLKP